MKDLTVRLAVEEVAVALAQVGEGELGRAMLADIYGGTIAQSDIDSRMLAAGHSLMARRLLEVSGEGSVRLEESLADAMRRLCRAELSVRAARVQNGEEVAVAFHLVDGSFIEQRVEREVVHEITAGRDGSFVERECMALYPIEGVSRMHAEFLLPITAMTDLDAMEDLDDAVGFLVELGTPAEHAYTLASDVASAGYRGSIVVTHHRTAQEEQYERGCMLVRAESRCWLSEVVPDEDALVLRVRQVDADSLRDVLRSMLVPSEARQPVRVAG